MKILISGGCKNGKSSIAEAWIDRAADHAKPLYYLATMVPKDEEDHSRIQTHRRSRAGIPFTTIEVVRDIHQVISLCDPAGFYLLDSTTALLENEMFGSGQSINQDAGQKTIADLNTLLDRIGDIVIVSDYIYSDAFHYDELTEQFRRSLAQIDRALATRCDLVLEVSFGQVIVHKGQDLIGYQFLQTDQLNQQALFQGLNGTQGAVRDAIY
jgi:adenosylcobinamide kinase/adenosylcobinamide-phosphate guanylyltransferase